jgi:D-psicose/D-tagatose/L-ribulose 3-epimerase
MRTSMNLLLWTTHVTEEHYPLLEKLRDAGFDGVEIPIFQGDEAHYKKLGAKLKELGLGSTAVTVIPSQEQNPLSPDKAARKKGFEHIALTARKVAAMGGEILCGPFHSPLGVFTGTGPTEDEKKRCAEVIHAAAEHAQKVNVKLAIEYLNRFECYFLTTAADTKEFVKRVNHPNFRMMYDTFHANIEEKDIAKTVAGIADVMVHVHISENDRGIPGTRHVGNKEHPDWTETFKALHKANYDGWLVIEAFGRALPDLAAATRVWRDLFAKPEDVYTQGLRFMKIMWEEAR